jgi:hypothetical protein
MVHAFGAHAEKAEIPYADFRNAFDSSSHIKQMNVPEERKSVLETAEAASTPQGPENL